MSQLYSKYFKDVTLIQGGGVIESDSFRGHCYHLIVRALTPSNIFNFTIVDQDINGESFAIFQRQSVEGEINEFIDMSLKGFYNFHIDSATIDEKIRIYLAMKEI